MTEEILQRAKQVREELLNIEQFLESSTSDYSKLELVKERAEHNAHGDAYTVNYKCKVRSELGRNIVELLKARKAELEAEFEKL